MIVRAAWCPLCMATSATPGRPFERHQIADDEHLRVPGQRAVGLHLARGPRGRRRRRARRRAAARATRPARLPPRSWCGPRCGRPRRRGRSRRRRRPGCRGAARPPAPRGRAGLADAAAPGSWAARCPRASSSTIRALAGSKRRKLARSARRESSAICPASSTPVGPAPTIANVSHGSRAASSGSSSAISKAPKIRPRSSSASSIVFIPGASRAYSSCPK